MLDLIYNRTQSDVANGEKIGYYNYDDLNRVGSAMQYVQSRLYQYGYNVEITPKTDWQEGDIPTREQMELYIHDIKELRGKLALMQSTPQAPDDMDKLTYIEANNIEKILIDIDYIITKMTLAWYYSGELYAGEV